MSLLVLDGISQQKIHLYVRISSLTGGSVRYLFFFNKEKKENRSQYRNTE